MVSGDLNGFYVLNLELLKLRDLKGVIWILKPDLQFFRNLNLDALKSKERIIFYALFKRVEKLSEF